jgi:acetyl/propionyl-CoA carboxylase alpha subunit/acetyl-CoA carboxylase carboxyltransferase component
MPGNFERVAIVNRGEAAMRFIHAVREFNAERGTSLRTIALYTEPDRRAMFVREADEAVCLGPAQLPDLTTHHLKSSYVDYPTLERALSEARAEAAWVGWGFVAEHAQFAELCRDMGIVFIGPEGEVMRRLGDKISSKLLAEKAQIPVALWSGGPVETAPDAFHHAERLGYPLFIKATAGGGGHGIRRVHSAAELGTAFDGARREAFKAFGDPTVFMEQLVTGARHAEVQVIADYFENVWAAGVRDCTIQRRHQKVLEEAPSPALSPEQDQSLRDAAIRLSRVAGYHNAGTVEFLYEPRKQQFLFMEMNTRLQVEHPVTECTTGIDLVKLQIQVARGEALEGEPPITRGHAIEVRLNAEDAENGFSPSPGAIERFRVLTGPGIRIDTGVEEGDRVPAEFDSMIAKIIGFGRNREEARSRLLRALRQSVVVLKGGTSNRGFLMQLLDRSEVKDSAVDIGWLDRLAAKNEHLSRKDSEIALAQAAIEAYKAEFHAEQAQFYGSAIRGRPEVRSDVGHRVELRYLDHSYLITVYRLGLRQYRLEMDGVRLDAQLDSVAPFEYWLTVRGARYHVVSVGQESSYRIEVDGVSHRIDRDDGGVVRAPSPAVVVSIAVKPGEAVNTGDRLAVLEAMKMEMEVTAPFPGKVRQVMAIPNVQVSTGAPLMQIEPALDAATKFQTERLCFASEQPACSETEGLQWQLLDELRQLLLGFDITPERTKRVLAQWNEFPDEANCERACAREEEILSIFVDICSLFRKSPKLIDDAEGPSTEAYLFSFLRMLDTKGGSLPEAFLSALQRTLTHYGITSLDRSPGLEESLFWIYKSHQRVEQQIGAIERILSARLERLEIGDVRRADEAFGTLLDRMISNTRVQFPTVSDLARELRYRCCDEPLFSDTKRKIYATASATLDYLDAHPNAPDAYERTRSLIECPQPLAGLFSSRFSSATQFLQQLMLEVMTSRYYSARKLKNLGAVCVEERWYLSSEYQEQGEPIRLLSQHAEHSTLKETLLAAASYLGAVPRETDVVLDLMTWKNGPLPEPDQTSHEIEQLVNEINFPLPIRRLVVGVSGPDSKAGNAKLQHFTFEPGPHGYEEVALFRGVHPMLGERLHLWRLQNFNVTRVPSPDDIYLLHAVAKENPKDERLFAVAEVRDLTPVRNKTGKVVQLPYLEQMFAEAVAAMRMFQAKRDPRKRLYWNRIFLYVWPTFMLQPDEVNDIVSRLAPQADGLGLEQVVVRMRIPNPRTGELRDTIMRISAPGDAGLLVTFRPAAKLQPMKPLTAYDQKVVKMRQRGMIYPYEIIKLLTPSAEETRGQFPTGEFVELDLDAENRLVPVQRPHGENKSNVIVGTIRNFTDRYPEGMKRVVLLGDPSKDLGALAEPECRRIIAALELASEQHLPLEWFTLSAGAKISMQSGVENMDWIALVLRYLVEFTQAGGEVNLIVNGINVGAQPYWNAEATMLMHTKGILIMTPKAAMVLTGKRALDYSGSISAEDNQGIGGYDRIMGVNGQAQYFARDIDEACQILMRHYEHTYVAPGERFPRRARCTDPIDRDVRFYPYADTPTNNFRTVGDIFSDDINGGRKKSFDIRKVMMAVRDQDYQHLERWSGMRSAETAVIWDAHLGGNPVCMIGIQSKPVPRFGFVPADGPDQWTAGTLFPLSSKKIARAINAASSNRPVVILANLSGFDGSPESMRRLQLEYGAEIGRAVVNFKGPMVFCVISRYHGGAYVVFSRKLNENLEVVALEGTYASVIGGAPAAAVVFAGEVEARARKDDRVVALATAMENAQGADRNRLRAEYNEKFKIIHSEKLGEMAAEFDRIHCVQRALQVGALTQILPPRNLRAFLVGAVERGIERFATGTTGHDTLNLQPEGVDVAKRSAVAAAD